MAIIVVIAIVILIGVFFLLRSPAPNAPQAPTVSDADAKVLREAVVGQLRARLVGWTLETVETDPLEVVAVDETSGRRRILNLKQLAEVWGPAHAAGDQEAADALVESFVAAHTGEGEGEEANDLELMRAALALQLFVPGKLPKPSMSRDVGSLKAVLVVRNPNGPEAVTHEELASWGLSEAEAFQLAFENLQHDVEDGLTMERFEEPDKAVQIAPGDPLAASYALVPGLATSVRKKLGSDDVRYYVRDTELVAAVGAAIELDSEALIPEAVSPESIVWKA